MNCKRLREYIWVSRDFNAQLEAYLLTDSKRRDWSETKVNLRPVYTSGPKVIPRDEDLKKSWLVLKGEVAKTLVDGEGVIFNVFACTDGHLKQAALVKIWKQDDDEAHLIYREALVILEKPGGNFKENSGLKGHLHAVPVSPERNPPEDVSTGPGAANILPFLIKIR